MDKDNQEILGDGFVLTLINYEVEMASEEPFSI